MEQLLELQLFENNDKTHRISIVTPPEGFSLDADGVSHLIGALSEHRAMMLPPVQREDVQIAGMTNVANDPRILWAYDEMGERAALVVRHPGYGWIGYALPFESVAALKAGLQKIVDHRNAQRRTPN